MNNLFKETKKERIDLESNWYMCPDGFKGICLVNYYPAERKRKTGEIENYIKEDTTYHPTVGQALRRFVELSQKPPSKTIEEILEKMDKILKIVEEFKENYKNW